MSGSAPPFSGVVGSGRQCGVNLGSRVFRAGFTGTRRVLVSAVPSAGVGGPAPLLGGPGVWWSVVGLGPAGQVGRGIGVSVGAMPVGAGVDPVSQSQRGIALTAGRTYLAGGKPAV